MALSLSDWEDRETAIQASITAILALPNIRDGSLKIDYVAQYKMLSKELGVTRVNIATLNGTLTTKPSRPGLDDDGSR